MSRSLSPRWRHIVFGAYARNASFSFSIFYRHEMRFLTLVVALLIFTLFKNLLFASSSSDYYYYSYSSSSVVETRVNSEGRQETSRKESSDLKTNIPGLRQEDVLSSRPNLFYFDE